MPNRLKTQLLSVYSFSKMHQCIYHAQVMHSSYARRKKKGWLCRKRCESSGRYTAKLQYKVCIFISRSR